MQLFFQFTKKVEKITKINVLKNIFNKKIKIAENSEELVGVNCS